MLTFNLSSAMKRLVLGRTVEEQAPQSSSLRPDRPSGQGGEARQEADHPAGPGHPSYELLLRARQRILALAAEPYRA